MCCIFLLYVIVRFEEENDLCSCSRDRECELLVSVNKHALDQIVVIWCITVVLVFVNRLIVPVDSVVTILDSTYN